MTKTSSHDRPIPFWITVNSFPASCKWCRHFYWPWRALGFTVGHAINRWRKRTTFRQISNASGLGPPQHALTKFPIFLRTMNARQWLCIAIAARTSERLLISATLHLKVSQQQRLEKSRRIQVPWQDKRLIEGCVSITSQSVFIRHCVNPFAHYTAAQGRC